MDVVPSLEAYAKPADGCVICIGNFDGVHRGHQRMLTTARSAADEHGIPLVVLTFEPHPIASLRPEEAPPRIITYERKLDLLRDSGVDTIITIGPDADFFKLTPEAFIQRLTECCSPKVIVEGPTFGFGADRAGNVETLRALSGRHGFEVIVVERLTFALDGIQRTISSSKIRALIAKGAVREAAAMISRWHTVSGVVGYGEGRGADLGFPTINIEQISEMVPGDGVYAAIARLPDGQQRAAAVNVGQQPTFETSTFRVEAHLLDHDDGLRDANVELSFVERLRGQVRFDGIEALQAQLGADVARVRVVVSAEMNPRPKRD